MEGSVPATCSCTAPKFLEVYEVLRYFLIRWFELPRSCSCQWTKYHTESCQKREFCSHLTIKSTSEEVSQWSTALINYVPGCPWPALWETPLFSDGWFLHNLVYSNTLNGRRPTDYLSNYSQLIIYPTGTREFSLLQNDKNGCGAHPASYWMGSGGSILGGEAAEVWTWPLTSTCPPYAHP
jgi:hypothetical protein